jgi:hypothetical protein
MGSMGEREHVDGAIPPEPGASERPHDVLAAEQFAMPAPQAAWHGEPPPVLPPEPNESDEPHDVLAAEEFAMPAPPPHVAFASVPEPTPDRSRRRLTAVATGVGFALAAIARRRCARRRG